MSVISLDERRAPGPNDVTRCTCGSEWFRLHGHDQEPPAVVLDSEGRITGYAGHLECNDCGRMQ